VAVRLGENFSVPGLQYFSRLSELEGHLSGILDCKVDVIEEPVRKKRLQTEIDRDRAIAFWQTRSPSGRHNRKCASDSTLRYRYGPNRV
jgi:hypothetical protein